MIREIERKDASQLRSLIKIALEEKIFITKKKNHHFFGYFENNKLIAIVGYFTMKKYKTIGFINAFVLPEYRNRGIYKKLSEVRFNYCKEKFPDFTVFISVNDKSRPQVENMGFKLIETQYRMYMNFAPMV